MTPKRKKSGKSDKSKPVEIAGITLYPVEALAKAFSLSPATVRRYLTSGKIKGQKLGHTWYVTEDQLRALFEE